MTDRTIWEEAAPDEEAPIDFSREEDALLERTIQIYLEYRLVKRPPESAPGAARKALGWLEEEALRRGRKIREEERRELSRAFLDVEGDVAEAVARRRASRRRPTG